LSETVGFLSGRGRISSLATHQFSFLLSKRGVRFLFTWY
jgi:hypothetical protein